MTDVLMRRGRDIRDVRTKKRPCEDRGNRQREDHVKTQPEGTHVSAS